MSVHEFDRYSAVSQMANEARRTAEAAATQVAALANQMEHILMESQSLDRKVDVLLAEAAERRGRSLEKDEAERVRAEAISDLAKKMESWAKLIAAICALLAIIGPAAVYLITHLKP